MIRRLRACAVPVSLIRLAAVSALVCAVSYPSAAAITYNSSSSKATTGTEPNLSWSHEVFAGDDRILIVGLSMELGQSTSVTYGGLPLALIGRYTGTSSHTIELWRRVAPPVGSATILATFDTSREVIGGATAFNGVDPVTPAAGFLGASTDSDSPSVTITSAAGELVIDTLFVDIDNLAATPDGSQTQRWNLTNGRQGAGSTKPGGAGSVVMSWTLTGSEEWTLAGASLKPVVGSTISGTVFEDANFAGTASAYDGGAGDKALQGVDVELYNGGTDAYITSTATAADGSYSFSGLADGSYKVRARSSTIGSGGAAPRGGLNACVPATCASPLPEMTWGSGTALYGGQSATVDDTATGDNLGPGDHYLPVTVSGANVSGVDFGFAYNLIVNTADDANAANVRSAQGSLRQFVKNANAIGTAVSTTADASEFRMQVATNQSDGGDAWWRITAAAAMTSFTDAGTTLDGSTQAANAGSAANGRGPDIELFGNNVVGHGLNVDNVGNTTIRELTINSFQDDGIYIHEAGANGTDVFGCYVGTDGIGENALPNLDYGIRVNNSASNTDIGSATPGDGNLISGNGDTSSDVEIRLSGDTTAVTVRGNKIGTDRTGTQPLGGVGSGIGMVGPDGVTVGGSAAGDGNIISGNDAYGIVVSHTSSDITVQGNSIGVGITGSETNLGNGSYGVFVLSQLDPSNIAIGGTGAGEGNLIAENVGIGVRTNTSGLGDSIQGNTIRDNDGGGIQSSTDSVLIAKNLVVNNTGRGIHLSNDSGTSANNNKVYQNTVHGSSSHGIWVAGSGVLLRNSIVTGSGGYGINVTGSMTESDNLITDAAIAPANASGRSNVALDAGDLNLDPRYVNAAAGDYTLNQCLSPAVEWGADLGADQPDMNGAIAGKFNGSSPDQGAFETTCTQPAIADLEVVKSDSPDPAPADGPLVYTLIVTNNGPGTATNTTVTDVLPPGTTFASATPSQGTCSGTGPVNCNFGAVLNSGTASVEILIVTGGAGLITNNASVAADQADLVPGNDADSEDTNVVVGGSTDVPLTQFTRFHGFVDSTSIGGTLRTQPNSVDACAVGGSDSETLADIPDGATVVGAYLYWAGSGVAVDDVVTFDGSSVTADRTFQAQLVLGATNYDFFGGFEDVTTEVAAKGNGSYSFSGLTVDTGSPFCNVKAVLAGWSLLVVYEDSGLTGKTLVIYDGFDLERNGSTSYVLTGIWAADPPEAKSTYVLWEGDPDLSGTSEKLEFNGTALSDATNPANNVYNSTINSVGSTTAYGVDVDTFDVSSEIAEGDTLANTEVFAGPDLVILNAVLLQVKSNIIVGSVFEDVNYGGGLGRNLTAASTAAPSFSVGRPGAVLELYDAAGNFLRTTTTDADGEYGFAGLIDGVYIVRSVNDTVDSSRPGASGSEWPVQTYRTDASTGAAVPVTTEVGGADPGAQDSPENLATANLASLTAQSVTPIMITTGVAVPGVDFGYNFDTIVNTNNDGQGSLRRFILNSNSLTNANLDQDDAPAGVSAVTKNPGDEHSIFMIPAAELTATIDGGGGTVMLIQPITGLDSITDTGTVLDGRTQTALTGDTNGAVAEVTTGPEVIIDLQGTLTAEVLTVRGDNTVVDSLGLTGALGVSRDGIDAGALSGAQFRNNTIFDNGALGIYLNAVTGTSVTNSVIRNNGVAEAVADGIVLTNSSTGNTISGNEIVANAGFGIDLTATGDNGGNTITGNLIKGNGVSAGDQNAGIKIDASDNSSVTLNTITENAGDGIVITSGDTGNLISQNSIFNNGELGIDLSLDSNNGGDGVTLNDDPDMAGGGNNRQNFPEITSAGWNGADTIVKGTLTSTPGATFDIEIFSNSACNGDQGGSPQADTYGEGETYRATANVTDGDVDGIVAFSVNVPVNLTGQQVTATATDTSNNDTSEFSVCYAAATLSIVKRAFQADGTPITNGSTLPAGMPVKFLLYIDNPGSQVADVSLQDVLNALFGYQTGSIKVDQSLDSATVCPGGLCDEAAIFAKVDGTPSVCGMTGFECTDTQDADAVSLSGTTIHAGDGVQSGNAQLDLPAGKISAVSFTIVMQ